MDALWFLANSRQELPDLLGSEAHDGSQQTNQHLADTPDGRLSGTSRWRTSRIRVQTVLEDIEIKIAEFRCAEGNHPLVNAMKLEFFIPTQHVPYQIGGQQQHV